LLRSFLSFPYLPLTKVCYSDGSIIADINAAKKLVVQVAKLLPVQIPPVSTTMEMLLMDAKVCIIFLSPLFYSHQYNILLYYLCRVGV